MNCHYADDIGLDLSTIALELKNEEILNNIKNQINNQSNTNESSESENESESNDDSSNHVEPYYKSYNSSPKKILPVHWTMYYDSNHGSNYYYNKVTGESLWTFPLEETGIYLSIYLSIYLLIYHY
jgi:hypothetical protein